MWGWTTSFHCIQLILEEVLKFENGRYGKEYINYT